MLTTSSSVTLKEVTLEKQKKEMEKKRSHTDSSASALVHFSFSYKMEDVGWTGCCAAGIVFPSEFFIFNSDVGSMKIFESS